MLGLVGLGAMGRNHLRVLNQSESVRKVLVFDKALQTGVDLGFAKTHVVSSPDELLDAAGVVIATPTDTHHSIAKQFIDSTIPVLIEKPMATTWQQVNDLVRSAEKSGSFLMCGFVERFNPAFVTAVQALDGDLQHFLSVRHSPKPPTVSSDVVSDLMIHDADLFFQIVGDCTLSNVGFTVWSPTNAMFSETADCVLATSNHVNATMSVSRCSQLKIRQLRLTTDVSMFEIDLLRGQVTKYRSIQQNTSNNPGQSYSSDTVIEILFVRHGGEPLMLQLQHFLNLIQGHGDIQREHEMSLPAHRFVSNLINKPNA